jgi:putative zinc finger protein
LKRSGDEKHHLLYWSQKGVEPMDHSEAVEQMATERYLLDELSPELRGAFEEHLFDCKECTLDLRAGAAFVDGAKAQLPEIAAHVAASPSRGTDQPAAKKRTWSSWWQPVFAMPAFACLLALIGYQNLETIPTLRSQMSEPRLLHWTSIHAGTRGAASAAVMADRKQGAVLLIELPQDPTYTSFVFDLYDRQNRQVWTKTVGASDAGVSGNGTLSLLIPGAGLQEGAYTIAITGLNAQGERSVIDRHVLDIHFDD